MSRTITSTHRTELSQRGGFARFQLLALTVGGTVYRWSNFGEITWSSQTWVRKGFSVSGIASEARLPRAGSVRVEDFDGVLRALAQIDSSEWIAELYEGHKVAGGSFEVVQNATYIADAPRWDAEAGTFEMSLSSIVPEVLPGLTMGVALGLSELVAAGTRIAFANEILVLN